LRAKTGAKELSEAETTEALQTALAFDITFYNDNELHLKALNLAIAFPD